MKERQDEERGGRNKEIQRKVRRKANKQEGRKTGKLTVYAIRFVTI
jgi:hypothetical protein